MSAEGIFANLLFAIPIGIIMFLLFIYLRSALPLFYHRNALCHGRAVFGISIHQRTVEWFRTILGIRDDELLRLAGLDALVTSNGFRLILLFAAVMTAPCLLILLPYYYTHSDHSDSTDFNTFTISDLYTDTFWPPLLILILLTFTILYGVYSFYANFIGIRQAFLLRPSALNSFGDTLNTAEAFGSIKYARKRQDSSICTVLLHPIPTDISLKELIENSGIKGLNSVQFIGNYHELKSIMDKRNSSLLKLENALKTLYNKLESSADRKFDDTQPDDLMVTERFKLLDKLLKDANFCSNFRPRHKTTKPPKSDPEPQDSEGTVDSIRHFYKKLMEREAELQEAIKNFKTEQKTTDVTDDLKDKNDIDKQDDFEQRYLDETTFISWKKVSEFSSNLPHFTPLFSHQAALLHFSDYKEAGRAQQILLTSRVNTMRTRMAPSVDDLNWKCLKWSERERWRGAVKSNLIYWSFVILFAPISAGIVAFIDMESLGKWFPTVEQFRLQHPLFREILQSVLAPFFATLLMKRTGIWISWIVSLRGPISKSELLLKSQSSHLFFLFFQVIMIGALFSNLYQFTATAFMSNGDQTSILAHLRENVPKKAHFFFNFMLQDIFIELMLELLNPKSLFFDRSFLSKSGRSGKNYRNLRDHDLNPPELELAFVWSRFIMFPFFIFMTYIIIAPLIVIPALIYFSVAYFVYRFRFSQFGRRSVETGGLYWRQCSQQIVYALIISQLSVLLQYTQFKKGIIPSIILILLLSLTIVFIPLLKRNFSRNCDFLPVIGIEGSKKVVQNLLNRQNKLLPVAVDSLENSKLIKSKLDQELKEHFQFNDIDPNHQDQSDREDQKEMIDAQNQDEMFHPYWTHIPLKDSSNEEIYTFDPFQVDHLVDISYLPKQYEHPLILKHYQTIIVPINLPKLLKEYENQNNI